MHKDIETYIRNIFDIKSEMKQFFQPPDRWGSLTPHRLRSMLIFDPDKQIRSIRGIKVYLRCDLVFNEILKHHCKK